MDAADSFVHPALFYRDVQEYLAGTVPFIQDGLAAGEPVAVAVPGPKLALLRAELGADAEAVRLIDMNEAGRNPGRIIPKVLRAFADAHPISRVRIIGEPIWPGRTAAEYPACVQHEALINVAFRGRDVTIVCPYDAVRLDATVLADAYATHPVIVDAGREEQSRSYDPDLIVATYNQPLAPPWDTLAYVFDAELLPSAREFAVGRARRLGLAGERLDDFALAVAELTTNSVVHGGGSGTVWVWSQDGQVLCEVTDAGQLSDPLAGRRPAAREQLGGRGLLMVHYLADLVRVHTSPEGTAIRFYFAN
ncbi:anti-sigma factor RsbA family regulatory protein [Streptomyces sp. NBC_00887]|uniref:anti-sigma factor RsbA family regulatory protein n=1 Tax=Streptomyces sp. NBC_00887 TaxID=2975859 RepID=UPI00386589A4|nr:anti-sigma factor RsbA family regulatory protein [Streptomyces sp. NBC_00887]WSY35747.1 anti-sigma factor RsbA family regulatory protein [Streptomyces sp. NBC_00887]